MSADFASRTSLADVLAALDGAAIDGRRRQELRSAIRAACRLIGRDPEAISAEPRFLRPLLEAVSPDVHGMSRGRWNNVRSLVGGALKTVTSVMPGRDRTPLSPGWERLLASALKDRRIRLQPFARFMSAKGIDPDAVTLVDLFAWRDAMANDRLRRDPEKAWDGFSWVWNACVREIPGWPSIPIERQDRRESYVLPWSMQPESLKVEVDDFLRWRSGITLDEDGPARPARATTLAMRERQLRVAASILLRSGVSFAELRGIADLVTLDRFKLVLRFMLDRNGGKTSSQIGNMAGFLKHVADVWVKTDRETVEAMKKVTAKLCSSRGGLRPKNRERLRPFDDRAVVEAFLDLPDRIRRELPGMRVSKRSKAVLAQTAVAIALLQTTAIRIRNLCGLGMRKHLIPRGREVFLVIPGDQVKNGEEIEAVLPPEVVDVLAWYIRERRPRLMTDETDALFPGANGRPKSPVTFGPQISGTVKRFLGIEVNPHLFRHTMGKLFLDVRPGDYETIRSVLAHRDIETTKSVYTGTESVAAGRHFNAVIATRRAARSAPVPTRSKRKGAA